MVGIHSAAKQLGQKGGLTTLKRYGKEHFKELARLSKVGKGQNLPLTEEKSAEIVNHTDGYCNAP